MNKGLLLAVLLATIGIANANDWEYKLTAKDKAQAIEVVKKDLKDPYSAKFEEVRLAKRVTDKKPEKYTSEFICLSVNAKNSYGAYIGARYTIVEKFFDTGSMKVFDSGDLAQTICKN